MAWTWEQDTGICRTPDGMIHGTGYSGAGPGKNNPALQEAHAVGPIPVGLWRIGPPEDRPTTGPYSLPLSPYPETDTFGRTEFYLHGDSISAPGMASHGCPVLSPEALRQAVWNSSDHDLRVVADEDFWP